MPEAFFYKVILKQLACIIEYKINLITTTHATICYFEAVSNALILEGQVCCSKYRARFRVKLLLEGNWLSAMINL